MAPNRTVHWVDVTLDTAANPKVTVEPDQLHVSKGKVTIKWQPADGQEDDWTFEWIRKPDKTSDLDDPPFSDTKVEDQEIEIEDDNEDGTLAEYHYAISVKKGEVSYNTDPRIINHS